MAESNAGQWFAVSFVGLLLILAMTPVSVPGSRDSDPLSQSTDISLETGSTVLREIKAGRMSTPQNNSTVIRHKNPEEINPSTDLAEIQEWLSHHLATRLRNSTIRLSQKEYALARRIIGDEYQTLLGKYVDVAEETRDGSDNEAGEAFERVQSNQRKFSSTVQQYRETHERFQEAQENGNTARARELARRLERQSEKVNRTAAILVESYRLISNLTGMDFSGTRQRIITINQQIVAQQIELKQDLFIATQLTAQTRSTKISYRTPLYVTGQLATANGTALSDRRIQLQIGGRTLETSTNSSGGFVFTHRPTLLSLNTSRVTIQYIPVNTSVYQSSQTRLSIEVVQVTPSITIARNPGIVGFNDEVSVSGRIGINQTSIQTVPIAVALDGFQAGTVQTNANGEFTLTVTLGADVPSGNRTIQAFLPVEDQALARVEATAPIRVISTPTVLTLLGSQTGRETIQANGRLTTEEGDAVEGQPIELRINGTMVARTTTTQNGEYSTTLHLPQQYTPTQERNTSITLAAVYEASGTNLNQSRAEKVIELTPSTNQSTPINQGKNTPISAIKEIIRKTMNELPLLHWIIIAVAGGALILGIILAYIYGYLQIPTHWLTGIVGFLTSIGGLLSGQQHREANPTDGQSAGNQGTSVANGNSLSPEGEASGEPADSATESPIITLLTEAQNHLEAGDTEEAIATSYMAVRQQIGEEMNISTSLTHREFLRACQENEFEDDGISGLEQLIDWYERAAYTPETMTPEAAEETIELARALA